MKLIHKDGREVPPSVKIGLIFVAIGFVFACIGVWHLSTTRGFMRGAVELPATVISNPSSCGFSEECTYKPTVRVITPDGDPLELRTQLGSSDYNFDEGAQITVLYNPAYGHIRIGGFMGLWLLGGAFTFLGFGAMAMGLLVVRAARRQAR